MKNTVAVYKCLCDETRLRILNLLHEGPLCVCHLQELLDEPQAKISKQLAFMRRHDLVTYVQRANWRIYSLPEEVNPLLTENLKCLQDLKTEGAVFRADLRRLAALDTSAAGLPDGTCCVSKPSKTTIKE